VRRLVYLSSAVVHGHHPAPGTHDDSPLIKKQPFAYNVSKVMAEELLHRLRSDRSVEVVTLRPSIVFGPRSQWTAGIAADLLEGRAYLIDGGSGICNTVYIDNLAQALWQAATSERAANQDFIITDGQKVTWRDLYDAMAEVVGVDIASVPSVESAAVAGILRQQKSAQRHAARNQIIGAIKQSLSPEFKRQVLRVLPLSITRTLRKWAASPPASPDSAGAGNSSGALLPRLDHEIVSLQQCRYVLPIQKAQSLLGYVPPFTFAEGCGKTAHWLRFAFGLASALGVY
jgi:nucleoside-diphosphate-sugar epimerase